MWNELKKEEVKLKEELETLKKHSNTIHMKLIRLEKWMLRNNYKKPFTGSSNDLNIIKYHRLVYDLSQVDIEINDVLAQIKEIQHDIYYLEMGSLMSAYAKGHYKIKLIDTTSKNIQEIYCNDYNIYLHQENKDTMIIVYEFTKNKINSFPYEKIIYIKEE